MAEKNKTNYKKSEYYLPASLSGVIINDYLVQYNRYNGLIISDEMNVLPIKKLMVVEKMAYMVLKSGVDILLLDLPPERIKSVCHYLKKQCAVDKEFKAQMYRSLRKILHYKSIIFKKKNKAKFFSTRYFVFSAFENSFNNLNNINNDSFRELNHYLSEYTTEITRNEHDLIPLSRSVNLNTQKFTVVSGKTSFFRELKRHIPLKNSRVIKLKSYNDQRIPSGDIQQIVSRVSTEGYIIITLQNSEHARLVKEIYKKNKNIIVINLLHLKNISSLTEIDTILSSYSDNEDQVKALLEVMFFGKEHLKELKKAILPY